MKRLIPALLALCLLLCACNGADTPATTEATTVATSEVAASTADEPTSVIRHPLTGAQLEEPFTGRVTTFTINNIAAAMPQHGTSQADVIYEVTVEGGATRCLALFTNLSEVGPIGSVRSARTYFISISRAYNAAFVHSGGSVFAKDDFSATGMDHIDADPSAFYRDSARRSAGYAVEHTHFTTGEKILAVLESKFDMTAPADANYGFNFVDEQDLGGESAKTVTVNFGKNSGSKTTKFVYDELAGDYAAYQHGSEYQDGNFNEQLHFENVLVLEAVRTGIAGAPNVRHTLVGENSGYYINGGKIVPIKWTRSAEDKPFSYTLEDGTPLTMIPGKTYVNIVPVGSPVVCE